jgi:hypothetical protein
VGVAFGHLEVVVPEDLSDSQKIHALHAEIAGNHAAKVVEAAILNPGLTQRGIPDGFDIVSVRLAGQWAGEDPRR